MHKKQKKYILSLLFSLAGLLVCSCVSAPGNNEPAKNTAKAQNRRFEEQNGDSGIKILTIGTADSGGTMYPVGSAIAQAISLADADIKVNISASNGSLTNVEALRSGQIDLGLVSGDVAFCAYNATEEFTDNPHRDIRAIAAVYSSLSNWMAPDASGITYVHELSGKRIAVGPKDSTTELSARTALNVIGLNDSNTVLKNYGLGSGSLEVEKGNLDAVHGFAGIPIVGLTQLSNSLPSRLLEYTDEELDDILSQNQYYYKTAIPAGTYPGQMTDIKTFGVKCLICVNVDTDEEMVYQLTKILDEARPGLIESHEAMAPLEQNGFMCQDLPVPLHPGAKKYYMDAGYLTE